MDDRTYLEQEWLQDQARRFEDDSKWVDPRRRDEKSTHPYSYSEFFIHGCREDIREADDALYSDRIFQWERAKAEACWAEHMKGVRWDRASPNQIAAFISAYLSRPVEFVALAEGCNPSSGYEYFIVWFNYLKDEA